MKMNYYFSIIGRHIIKYAGFFNGGYLMRSSKYILLALIVSFAMAGCCCRSENKKIPERAVIARINNYDLTVSDFEDEVANPDKSKEEALDELITKKILLQEAQRESFDKDAKFMKEIER